MKIQKFIIKLLERRKLAKVNSGKGVHIGYNTRLVNTKNIYIGDNSYINGGYLIAGKNSKIIIGSNCLISYEVHIRTTTHNYVKRSDLILNQGEKEYSITIGDDCWIGFGAQIMPGVSIGKGSVIAAGAVVTHNTDDYGVYAGVPARKIKERE